MARKDWRQTTLAEVSVDVSYGYTESAVKEKIGPRFLRITDIQGGVVNWQTVPHCPISPSDHEKYCLQSGDIVIARTGNSTGESYLFRGGEDAVFASYLIRFRPDAKRVDPGFVWYCLRTIHWWNFISGSKSGSAQAGANAKVLGSFHLSLPPLAEQRRIAHILGTLDDKIELNRRMCETLEAMARALFKSWFVDFEPVRAKMDGRWKRGQSLPGLPARYFGLFPDSFQDSPLGQIPKGWEVRGLDQIADFLNGLALQKYPPSEDRSLPVIKIAQLRSGNTTSADRASADIPTEYVVEDGDVLFSWSGSLECVLWTGGRGALNQHLFKVTSKAFPKWFYYLWIHHYLQDFRHVAASKATTMGHIQRHHLSEALVVVPDARVFAIASDLLESLVDQLFRNDMESRGLAASRDTLLPKLLTGDLSAPDVEKLMRGRANA